MAKNFGTTWWGNRWLQSLTHIDYENRIPRGASYARSGAVSEVKVTGNIIKAKVHGRRIRPYSVTLIIPPFFPEDIERLIDGIIARPEIVSKMLKHELDPAVLDIASECGLKIFPEKWTDFKMQCNCPDWAVPCKHIAAVIYMMSREIDNNPFVVFQIHNVDLLAELKARGVEVEAAAKMSEVPLLKNIVEYRAAKDLSITPPQFHRVNFSGLSDRLEVLLMLLPQNPTFDVTGDFKEKYSNHIRRFQQYARKFIEGKISVERLFNANEINEDVRRITEDAEFTLEMDFCLNWTLQSPDNNLYDNDLLAEAARINPDFLPDYSPSTIALHQGILTSIHLLANGDIEPQIVKLENKLFAVRWLPCKIDPEVGNGLSSLDSLIPDRMIRVNVGKRSKYVLSKADILVSFLLGKMIPEISLTSRTTLTGLFFDNQQIGFAQPGETEIPGSICAWLSSYNIRRSRYTPVLIIDEVSDLLLGDMFEMSIAVDNMDEENFDSVPLSLVLTDEKYAASRLETLKMLADLAVIIPDVSRYVSDKGSRPLRYGMEQLGPLLVNIIPAVRLLGVKVLMPKSLETLVRPKPTLRIKKKNQISVTSLKLSDLFDFEWEVALGNDVVSMEEFCKLLGNAGKLLKFKGTYVYMDSLDLERVNNALSETENVTSGQLLQTALLGSYKSAPVTITDEARALIKFFTDEREIQVPSGINAELRPYQKRGYSWLYRNMRIGFGSILADDMGLGKTLQTITLIQKLKEDGQLKEKGILIVVPTGLLSNWQSEITRFAPDLTSFIYHGTAREMPKHMPDVLLTSYGVLRSDTKIFAKKQWAVMVIDEAQNIKNPSTAQCKSVKSIQADTHIALSGTPVENRMSEFWSIMDFANNGYLGSLKSFGEEYAKPIQVFNDENCAARFRKVTAPFMMRRMKTDKSIINDLPDKIVLDEYSSLTANQAALYHKTLEAAMAEIENKDTSDNKALFERQGLILQMILALKQICNHPAQYLKNGNLHPELSGKVEMLLDQIEAIVDAGEKVLIFTQFREMGDMIVKFAAQRLGTAPLFYHGGCSVKQRNDMVSMFQNSREHKVFVLSLKAAGTGLNLTAASHVIHFDLWWNPAVEAQATDRAYRIGQDKNVIVHRFITKDTFEEKINEMIQRKKHLAEMTVATGENWIGKLSNKELYEIFG